MKKAISLLAMFALAGCAGLNDVTLVNNHHTTIGQELLDLKKAYDEEIISSEEYEKLKKEIKDYPSFVLDVDDVK